MWLQAKTVNEQPTTANTNKQNCHTHFNFNVYLNSVLQTGIRTPVIAT